MLMRSLSSLAVPYEATVLSPSRTHRSLQSLKWPAWISRLILDHELQLTHLPTYDPPRSRTCTAGTAERHRVHTTGTSPPKQFSSVDGPIHFMAHGPAVEANRAQPPLAAEETVVLQKKPVRPAAQRSATCSVEHAAPHWNSVRRTGIDFGDRRRCLSSDPEPWITRSSKPSC